MPDIHPTVDGVRAYLRCLADPQKATVLRRFFKTGKGQYGEGDEFLGVIVPKVREVAKRFRNLDLKDTLKLLRSPIHEERQCALFILVDRYGRSEDKERDRIFRAYLANTRYINNWDLVDLTAPKIVGRHLADKPRRILDGLAKSNLLWDRRIAMLACFWFIGQGDCRDALRLAKKLLGDKHDLIHKAVGWMLREVGKKCSVEVLRKFLDENADEMPRTMLRYAIEKLPEQERKEYLSSRPKASLRTPPLAR